MKYFSILLLLLSFNAAFGMEIIRNNFAILSGAALLIKDGLFIPTPGKAERTFFTSNITNLKTTLQDYYHNQYTSKKFAALNTVGIPVTFHHEILSNGDPFKLNTGINKGTNQYLSSLPNGVDSIVESFIPDDKKLANINLANVTIEGLHKCYCYLAGSEDNGSLFGGIIDCYSFNTATLMALISIADIKTNGMIQRSRLMNYRNKNHPGTDPDTYFAPFEQILTEERITYFPLKNKVEKAREFQEIFRKALIENMDFKGFPLWYYALKNTLLPSLTTGCGYMAWKAFKDHRIGKAVITGLAGVGFLGCWLYGINGERVKNICRNLEHYKVARDLYLLKKIESENPIK